MRRCSSCRQDNPPDARFCVNCGRSLDAVGADQEPTVRVGARTCANCGSSNPGTYRFCTECGQPLAEVGPQRSGVTEDRIPSLPDEGPSLGPAAGERQADTVRLPSPPDLLRAKVTRLVSSEETESHLFLAEFVVGRSRGDLQIPEDQYLSGEHLAIRRREGRYVLEDLGSTNGTFVRLSGERVLDEGDEVMFGRQLFRFTRVVSQGEGKHRGKQTLALGFGDAVPRLVRILEGGVAGETYALNRTRTVIGRDQGHVTFPDDVLLSSVHASVLWEEKAGEAVYRVRDEESRNGIFLRIRHEWPLAEGAVFTAGRQVFRFEKAPAPPAHGQRTVRLDLDPTPLR